MPSDLPIIRWGIVATGLISSWFVEDLVLDRKDPKAKHIVQAIGSSSLQKGKDFVKQYIPATSPSIYGSYAEVYNDPNVDVIYIGTPHSMHKQNCLDAITAGKHVLCEKAFTLNAADAEDVIAAARAKGVFLMEAMWLRFTPLMQTLRRMLHEEKVIGDVRRMFCDFGLDMDIGKLGPDSRYRDPALGAGSLLDIGIYSLTWGLVSLDEAVGKQATTPKVVAQQSLEDGVDVMSSAILMYPGGRQGIVTSTTNIGHQPVFARVEGSQGFVLIRGPAPSMPGAFEVYPKATGSDPSNPGGKGGEATQKIESDRQGGRGFFWEADAVALDVAAGRKENAIMPLAETVRVMKIMDSIRKQGGARFPQDHD